MFSQRYEPEGWGEWFDQVSKWELEEMQRRLDAGYDREDVPHVDRDDSWVDT